MNLMNMIAKNPDKLDDGLKNAALDPGFRPVFYKVLLASDIYALIAAKKTLPNGKTLLKTDKNIPALSWKKSNGELIIPIFSSEKEMRKAIKRNEAYFCINAKVLFSSNPGAQYVINPLSDYGKELTAYEIKSLLDNSLFNSNKRIKLEKNARVLLSQPSAYPHKLIKSLSTYFLQHREVSNAYVAQIHNCETGEEPRLLLALEGPVDLSNVFSEISVIIGGTIAPDSYVDMFQLEGDGGLDSYFRKIKPFYTSQL